MRKIEVLIFGLLLAMGCSSSRHVTRRDIKVLHRQAAGDFGCSARQLVVTPYGAPEAATFLVQGCGKRAMYRDTGDGIQIASQIEIVAGTAPAPGYAPPPGSPPPPPPPPPPAP